MAHWVVHVIRHAVPLSAFVVIVVARRLRHRLVLRLLHGLLKGYAAIGGFGEIACPQTVSGEFRWIKARLLATRFHDQVDRLGDEGLAVVIAPLVDAAEDGAAVEPGFLEPSFQRGDGPRRSSGIAHRPR